MGVYKTVFTVVFYNTADSADIAEDSAIGLLETIMGKTIAEKIITNNYPITTEMHTKKS